jgi:hypothetical protein
MHILEMHKGGEYRSLTILHIWAETPPGGDLELAQSEAMARGASQGVAAPWVHPHRQHHLSGPPRSGGCMAMCGGSSQ